MFLPVLKLEILITVDNWKHADVTPVHEKENKNFKTNYKPVSILKKISKTYETLIYNQLYDYFDDILSPSYCGFHTTQHGLLVMLERFKESVDKGNELGALLTDLSSAFVCIDRKTLIAKLFWYEVSPLSLNLMFSYLSNRTQRVKIKTCHSDKKKINK